MRLATLTLAIWLISVQTAHAEWFLYRKSSGESKHVSTSPFDLYDSNYFEQVEDTELIDGKDTSIPKIYDGVRIRNATPGEIAGFAANEDADLLDKIRKQEIDFLQDNSRRNIAIKALIKNIVAQFNVLRAAHGLPAITKEQVINALTSDIQDGFAD